MGKPKNTVICLTRTHADEESLAAGLVRRLVDLDFQSVALRLEHPNDTMTLTQLAEAGQIVGFVSVDAVGTEIGDGRSLFDLLRTPLCTFLLDRPWYFYSLLATARAWVIPVIRWPFEKDVLDRVFRWRSPNAQLEMEPLASRVVGEGVTKKVILTEGLTPSESNRSNFTPAVRTLLDRACENGKRLGRCGGDLLIETMVAAMGTTDVRLDWLSQCARSADRWRATEVFRQELAMPRDGELVIATRDPGSLPETGDATVVDLRTAPLEAVLKDARTVVCPRPVGHMAERVAFKAPWDTLVRQDFLSLFASAAPSGGFRGNY
jgi:hypothetical protein